MSPKYLLPALLFLIAFSVLAYCNNGEVSETEQLIDYFNEKAIQLEDEQDLDELVHMAGERDLVLLGEASHGTTDFYSWRASISKRLIEEKGFSFIAVEGDFAALYHLNKYVKDLPGAAGSAEEVVREFDRWPEWMWANEDIVDLAEWMREYNEGRESGDMAGFYGMDVYGHWEAMEDLDNYIRDYLPDYREKAQEKLMCFASYTDEHDYARAAARGQVDCSEELKGVVELLKDNSSRLKEESEREYFRAKQNAYVVKNAEDFYRLAPVDDNESWNSRATHMWRTVQRIASYRGEGARGVVWAHNTHIGDARATSMHDENRVNIGALSRQEMGRENVFSIGFGTYTGTVAAGSSWGSRMEIMELPEGREESYEYILGSVDLEQYFLIFDQDDRDHELLSERRGHRAVGVVYNPVHDAGNYVPTVLPERYDAFIFIRETSELQLVR